jgi:protein disulfide-isomerase A6
MIKIILFFFIIYLFYNIFFKDNFTNTNNKIKIYNFNTSWCGHSRNFQPIWDNFVKTLSSDDNIDAVDAKCDDATHEVLMKKYNILGFPTVIIDNGSSFTQYTNERTVNGLRNALDLKPVNNIEETGQIVTAVTCNNNTNNNTNNDNTNTKIYNFNTSWCGYSLRFQPVWDEFASKNNGNVEIIDVKCDNDSNKDLCNKYDIPGFPSVLKVNSNKITLYNGPRTVEGLINFSKE